ncbi:HbrB-like-domain-containing protein [Daedaleopsis nitida]|nr:HbrB-like-domain-containing protein [Daedaleopsis nitida]
MAGRSAHVRRHRSSSHGDGPRTPIDPPLFRSSTPPPLSPPSDSYAPWPTPPSSAHPTTEQPHKRLGLLDMLHSHSNPPPQTLAQRAGTSPLQIPASLLPARAHSRGDSGLNGAQSPVSPSSMAAPAGQLNKGHTSPSKASSTRTYDSKLVSREMHRLGNLAHLPSLAPSISAPQTSISLNMAPASAPSISSTISGNENTWQSLHVLVLPLFNGEQLRYPIEELNQLVKRHISTVVSAAPGKAVATLEHDTLDLIANGMVTLNSKIAGVEDDKLLARVVELWTFFWGQVLPYLEGSLLPLQTDPILSALYRLPKSHRPSSPTKSGGSTNMLAQAATAQIDVRALALVSFRDRVVLPLVPRLYARLTVSKDENVVGPESQQARLQQMLLVLVSHRQRLTSLSLTAPPPQPSAGEAAISRLLRALHAPLATSAPRHARPPGAAPSFLSAGLPRDRRGRIAQKVSVSADMHASASASSPRGMRRTRDWGRMRAGWVPVRAGEWDEGEADTPRVGVTFADPARERDKELLESLRSPDPESATRMGGWGLDAGKDEDADYGDDEQLEDEEDMQDWDHAQEMVEYLVGMKRESGASVGDSRRGYM